MNLDGRANAMGRGLDRMPATLDMIRQDLAGRGVLEVMASGGGVYVFARDGSDLSAWIPGAGAQGTVDWLRGGGVTAVVIAKPALVPAGLVAPKPAQAAPAQLSLFG